MVLSEQVLTVEEVAKYLRVPVDAIQVEIATGRLSAINVAGHVRIREYGLSDYMNQARTKTDRQTAPGRDGFRIDIHAAPDFTHKWPDGTSEVFTNVSEGVASIDDADYQIKVGFTLREAAGQLRARSLVLVNRYPSVEFVAEAKDIQPDSKMASIIRDRGGKQIPVGAEVPPEYAGKQIGPYRSIVDGRGARNGIAVICESRDLQAMVEHAVIRYRFRDERE